MSGDFLTYATKMAVEPSSFLTQLCSFLSGFLVTFWKLALGNIQQWVLSLFTPTWRHFLKALDLPILWLQPLWACTTTWLLLGRSTICLPLLQQLCLGMDAKENSTVNVSALKFEYEKSAQMIFVKNSALRGIFVVKICISIFYGI